MKNKAKKFIVMFVVVFAVFFGAFCAQKLSTSCTQTANLQTVFADESTQQAIENDGQTISIPLWNALAKFYNANKTEDMLQVDKYLYFDTFKNFPVTTLDLSGKNLDSIKNLSLFDLSSFKDINLSSNNLTSIDAELLGCTGLKNLNLSNNKLSGFSYQNLSADCYTNIQNLNISNNNISICDLSEISGENATIDATLNLITSSRLTLPKNLNVKVLLSHNLIDNPNTQNVNISYGFQGIKSKSTYATPKTIYFFKVDGIESVQIWKLQKQNNTESFVEQQLLTTLTNGQNYTFDIGYYTVKFVDGEPTKEIQKPIKEVYICPQAPTIKMYQGGKQLDAIQHKLTTPTTIKFFGQENAQLAFSVNGSELLNGNEYTFDSDGIYIVNVYQIIDGYLSEPLSLYLTYTTSTIWGWIAWVGGIMAFIALFYLAIKYMPNLVKLKIGKDNKNNNKENLDWWKNYNLFAMALQWCLTQL